MEPKHCYLVKRHNMESDLVCGPIMGFAGDDDEDGNGAIVGIFTDRERAEAAARASVAGCEGFVARVDQVEMDLVLWPDVPESLQGDGVLDVDWCGRRWVCDRWVEERA
jgi:hypothetical protein